MKSFTLILVTLAVSASAVQLPSCATVCVAKAIQKTGCASDNSQCICDSQHYLGYLRHCSAKRCSKSDKYAALQSAKDICGLVLQENSNLPASDNTLHVQARDTKYEKRQAKEQRADPPSWYSPEADHSWYSQVPEASYYSTVPVASYYVSAPAASYYSSAPAASYYTTAPAASYYTTAPAASYYSAGPDASYYPAAPTATVV